MWKPYTKISKDRNLTLGPINITEQVETFKQVPEDRNLVLG